MGTRISELPLETVPLDADFVPAVKSGITSRFTWTSIKAFLKTYFDTLYGRTEGTFTPSLQFGGAEVGITYSAQEGLYTRIGRTVIFSLRILLTSKGTSIGAARILNLPSTSYGSTINALSVLSSGITFADMLQAYVVATTTRIALMESSNAGVLSTINDTDFSNTSYIYIQGSYVVS